MVAGACCAPMSSDTDCTTDHNIGNPTEWRAMLTSGAAVDIATDKTQGNPFEPMRDPLNTKKVDPHATD